MTIRQPVYPPHEAHLSPDRFLSEGYAVGSTDEGKWLTVWGSAYHGADLVFPDKELAEARAEHVRCRTVESHRDRVIVRRVRRAGEHFLIVE